MAQHAVRMSARPIHRLGQLACSRGSVAALERSSSLPPGNRHKFSTDSAKVSSKFLSHSSIFLQDGLEIRELPLVIRKLAEDEIPITKMAYTGEERHEHQRTEQDDLFIQNLQNCHTVRHVFKLLEVPGENVTQVSACFALQRLCHLQEGITGHVATFIRKAVFNELCDTATKDMQLTKTDTLITLVKSYLKSTSFEQMYIDRINAEIEKRIGDGAFSIAELCSLIKALSENVSGDQNIANDMWIHLGTRYREVDENNMREVYSVLRYMSPRFKYVLSLLDKQVHNCWWKLSSADVALITRTVTMAKYHSHISLQDIGKWMFVHIHDINDAQFIDIVGAFNYFEFADENLTRAIERYVSLKIEHMDKKVVALALEYCWNNRCLSPRILDAVATDFQKHHTKYESHYMYHTLRVYGLLNYLPPNGNKFFYVIDQVLQERFTEFQPHQIMEMLVSFIYLKRFPVNFLNKVFASHFLAQIQGKNVSLTMVATQCVIGHKLLIDMCTCTLS